MISVSTEYMDIGRIAESGQCFRMERAADERSYEIVAGSRMVRATPADGEYLLDCDENTFNAFWKDYFDLGTDYSAFTDRIDRNDSYLTAAVKCGGGIRILRQDPWEMIVSFLISQQNNIKRIRRCISNISEKYGRKMARSDGSVYYAFPEPEPLAVLDEDALMECNLGYRSKYVVRAARDVCEGRFAPDSLTEMSCEQAREALLRLYGVGEKVADCICLFGLHHLSAFPVDTHIKQALAREYPDGFPFERYKGFEGVIQQYIFNYELVRK